MVKKKRRKKVSKKAKVNKKNVKKAVVRPTKRKINLVLKNLALFAVLTLIFYFLSNVSNNELFITLFELLAMILGFVGLAFLIVFLALLILKSMKK